jgi:hypothetical protein
MARCDQELCPNWGGDGRVCECVQLDIEPVRPRGHSADSSGDEVPDGD